MNKSGKMLVGVAAALAFSMAHAGVALVAARVGAENVEALAKFYESAFGMQEVQRFQLPSGPEVFLNFGDTVESAKANSKPSIAVIHRGSDAIQDPVPHVMLSVTDLAATSAAVKAAGSSMDGEPVPFGTKGMLLGFAVDPAGNRLELIQFPKP